MLLVTRPVRGDRFPGRYRTQRTSRGSDGGSDPAEGAAVDYDEDGFDAPPTPVLPFSPGADEAAVSAARRMLDAAAEEMGREID